MTSRKWLDGTDMLTSTRGEFGRSNGTGADAVTLVETPSADQRMTLLRALAVDACMAMAQLPCHVISQRLRPGRSGAEDPWWRHARGEGRRT